MLLMLRHPGLECEPSLLAEVHGAGGIMPIDLWNGPLEAVLKGNATRSIRGDSGGLEGKTDERIAQQLFLRGFNSLWAMNFCAVFMVRVPLFYHDNGEIWWNHHHHQKKHPYHPLPQILLHLSTQRCSPQRAWSAPPPTVARAPTAHPSAVHWPRRQPTPGLQDQCLRQLGKQAAGCLDAERAAVGLVAKRFTGWFG